MYSRWNTSPYDLELYHFGILGMKWGVRRFQNKDGTLTKAGKERKKYFKEHGDDYVLSAGSKAYRIAGEKESYSDHKRKYMYVTPSDQAAYEELVYDMGGLIAQTSRNYGTYINEAKKDVLVKNGEQVLKDIIDKYGDDSLHESLARVLALQKEFPSQEARTKYYEESISWLDKKGNVIEEAYKRDMQRSKDENHLEAVKEKVWDVMENHQDEVLADYKKKGYDAIVDPYDFVANVADMPIIVLDPAETIKNLDYVSRPGADDDDDW